jgi:hypothetical protein
VFDLGRLTGSKPAFCERGLSKDQEILAFLVAFNLLGVADNVREILKAVNSIKHSD